MTIHQNYKRWLYCKEWHKTKDNTLRFHSLVKKQDVNIDPCASSISSRKEAQLTGQVSKASGPAASGEAAAQHHGKHLLCQCVHPQPCLHLLMDAIWMLYGCYMDAIDLWWVAGGFELFRNVTELSFLPLNLAGFQFLWGTSIFGWSLVWGWYQPSYIGDHQYRYRQKDVLFNQYIYIYYYLLKQ